MMQVFGHFQSDKACSYNNGTPYLFFRKVMLYPVGVFHIAQCEDTVKVNAFQRRTYWR